MSQMFICISVLFFTIVSYTNKVFLFIFFFCCFSLSLILLLYVKILPQKFHGNQTQDTDFIINYESVMQNYIFLDMFLLLLNSLEKDTNKKKKGKFMTFSWYEHLSTTKTKKKNERNKKFCINIVKRVGNFVCLSLNVTNIL